MKEKQATLTVRGTFITLGQLFKQVIQFELSEAFNSLNGS